MLKKRTRSRFQSVIGRVPLCYGQTPEHRTWFAADLTQVSLVVEFPHGRRTDIIWNPPAPFLGEDDAAVMAELKWLNELYRTEKNLFITLATMTASTTTSSKEVSSICLRRTRRRALTSQHLVDLRELCGSPYARAGFSSLVMGTRF